MLKTRNETLDGKVVTVSGSGNVAQYACEKLIELGAKPVTLSDSSGFIYDPDGISKEKLKYVKELKEKRSARISEYAKKLKPSKIVHYLVAVYCQIVQHDKHKVQQPDMIFDQIRM